MQVLDDDNCIWVDVDDTLVMWDKPKGYAGRPIKCRNKTVWPHLGHIEQLKRFQARNQPVVVWSQGGYKWAKTVVKLLKLEKYVTLIVSKPKWFMDDKPASAWLPEANRIYLDPNGNT